MCSRKKGEVRVDFFIILYELYVNAENKFWYFKTLTLMYIRVAF